MLDLKKVVLAGCLLVAAPSLVACGGPLSHTVSDYSPASVDDGKRADVEAKEAARPDPGKAPANTPAE